jgi:hypothetical protein
MLESLSASFDSSPKLALPVTWSAVPVLPLSSVTPRIPLSVIASDEIVAAPLTSKVPPLTVTARPCEFCSPPEKLALPPIFKLSLPPPKSAVPVKADVPLRSIVSLPSPKRARPA